MDRKEEILYELMKKYTRQDVCVAFSGGADSSLLLKMAVECAGPGVKVHAVTFDTVLHPSCDLETAKKVAEETGAIHKIIFVDELENQEIKKNPTNRCYLCKKILFQKLKDYARDEHISVILEGTNEDDLHVYRPGLAAVRELGIYSPLAQAGFTKKEVRTLAKHLGISVASRPAAPCMATRLPYGTQIETELLKRIEKGEDFLRKEGFQAVRLRIHQEIARIEIPVEEFGKFLEKRTYIAEYLKKLGFIYITLDVEGFRSGSMDIHLPPASDLQI